MASSRSSGPTSRSSRPSASSTASSVYWCVINGRTYVRWVLPYDEDTATAALARLHAADADRLTPEARLLGAFRACGLLVPVWEVPADTTAGDYPDAVEAMGAALASAAADDHADSPPTSAGPAPGCSTARSPCADSGPAVRPLCGEMPEDRPVCP